MSQKLLECNEVRTAFLEGMNVVSGKEKFFKMVERRFDPSKTDLQVFSEIMALEYGIMTKVLVNIINDFIPREKIKEL